MRKHGAIVLGLVGLIFFSIAPSAHSQQPSSETEWTESDVAEAISQLNSNKFQLRQSAFMKLVQGGETSIFALEQAAVTDDIETATRCVEALVQIAGEEATAQAAIAALERLASKDSIKIASLAARHAENLHMTDEERAIKALTEAGAQIQRRPDGAISSIAITSDRQAESLKSISQVYSVRLYGPNVTDAAIRSLSRVGSCSRLTIMRARITDAGLLGLRNVNGLKSISVFGDNFSSAGLHNLQHMQSLTSVQLSVPIDESMIDSLLKAKQIQSVYLSSVQLEASHAALLNRLDHLNRLAIALTAIDDEVMKAIAQIEVPLAVTSMRSGAVSDVGWKHLENASLIRLNIYSVPVSDAALESIGKIHTLESLSIGQSSITDAGLSHLHQLQSLTRLHIRDGEVSKEALAKLREGLPKLRAVSVRE